ncbi:hypothetical protein KSB_74940 [Ktedonobacter robiniae]|uniref:Uncharacterized protein n=1 Tax=Ktedonobacter robiniae TaxID=2778365 RepID=A0ABQ3V2A4_9CHLR|nr:hypothetical protein KSB_74940 [Ktedonobacter robiniae]
MFHRGLDGREDGVRVADIADQAMAGVVLCAKCIANVLQALLAYILRFKFIYSKEVKSWSN